MRAALAIVAALAGCLLFVIAAPAWAQISGGVPNPVDTTDGLGVDLATRSVRTATPGVAIGNVSWSQTHYYSVIDNNYGWRSSAVGEAWSTGSCLWTASGIGACGSSGTYTYVALGDTTTTYRNGEPVVLDGSSWSANVLTTKHGSTLTFGQAMGTSGSAHRLLTAIASPTGDVITYTYKVVTSGGCSTVYCIRLSSINSNSGYQVKLEYADDSTPSSTVSSAWQTVAKAIAINNAFEYCSPTADTCSEGADWASVSFATAGDELTVTDEEGRETVYTFDGDLIESIQLPGSASADIEYAYSGNAVTGATGGGVSWAYAGDRASGVTAQASGGDPRVFQFATGQVVQVDNPDLAERIVNLGANNLPSWRLSRNILRDLLYDARGNLTTGATGPSGGNPDAGLRTVSVFGGSCANRVVCNKPTSETAPDGTRTAFTYDSTHGGVLTATVLGSNDGIATDDIVTTYTYAQVRPWYFTPGSTGTPAQGDQLWRVSTISVCSKDSDCTGETQYEVKTTVTYQSGSSSIATNALSASITIGAGGGGGPTRTSSAVYDKFSRVVSVDGPLTTADGLSNSADDTSYTIYDPDGDWVINVGPDPDGGSAYERPATKVTLDEVGRAIRQDNGTATISVSSGVATLTTFTTVAYSTITFDDAGRTIAQRTFTAGNTALSLLETSYDGAGRVECVAARMNPSLFGSETAACTATTPGASGPDQISKTLYDYAGHPSETIAGLGTGRERSTRTLYNTLDQAVAMIDPAGNRTSYEYDDIGRQVKTCYPHASNVGESSTSDCEQTVYDTDTDGSGTGDINTGHIAKQILRDGTEVYFAYDAYGNLTEGWFGKDSAGDTTVNGDEIKIVATYDRLNRPVSVARTIDVGGAATETTTFAYDVFGQVVSIGNPLGGSTRTVAYEYDNGGRRTKITYPGSFDISYVWGVSALNEIRQGSGGGSSNLATFAYDAYGRRTSLTRANGVVTTYGFDSSFMPSSLGLNLADTSPSLDTTWTLIRNQAGRLIERDGTSAAFDAAAPGAFSTAYAANGLNQLTTVGSNTPTYDGRGNLIDDDVTDFGFSLSNLLTSIDTSAALFSYDPGGRLSKVDASSDVLFLYDGADLIAEYDTSGNVLRRYVHGPSMDEPLVWYEGSGTGTKQYYVADQLGSIVAVTDSSGLAIDMDPGGGTTKVRSYDEYGNASGFAGYGRFGYTGQVWIGEAGAYNYKARFYNPALGRFLSPDPIGYGDGLNMYAYVGNDPINATDPWGLEATLIAEICRATINPGLCTTFFQEGFPGRTGIECGECEHDDIASIIAYLNDLFGATTVEAVVAVGSRKCPSNVTCLNVDQLDLQDAFVDLGHDASNCIGLGVAICVQSGSGPSQHYEINKTTKCSAPEAFRRLMATGAAPGAPSAVKGTRGDIKLFSRGARLFGKPGNYITQYVNSSAMTITNVTQRDHIFYYGTATMMVSDDGHGGSYIDAVGYGTGGNQLFNATAGRAIFEGILAAVKLSCMVNPE